MKLRWKNKIPALLLAVLAFGAVFSSGLVEDSLAYLTTVTEGTGERSVVRAVVRTEIEESFADWVKTVTVKNTGEEACFVRVLVLAGSEFSLAYEPAEGWSSGEDGYWYYESVLEPGAATASLKVRVTVPEGLDTDFNVVVLQEWTPVQVAKDGSAYADWDLTV